MVTEAVDRWLRSVKTKTEETAGVYNRAGHRIEMWATNQKVVNVRESGWLKVIKPDRKAVAKTLQITFGGFTVLDSFEKACKRAAMTVSKAKASESRVR